VDVDGLHDRGTHVHQRRTAASAYLLSRMIANLWLSAWFLTWAGRWLQNLQQVQALAVSISSGVQAAAQPHHRRDCALSGRSSTGRCSGMQAALTRDAFIVADDGVCWHADTSRYQLLEVFDSSAGELSPDAFKEFCMPYLRDISQRVKDELCARHIPVVPMTVFARGVCVVLECCASCCWPNTL